MQSKAQGMGWGLRKGRRHGSVWLLALTMGCLRSLWKVNTTRTTTARAGQDRAIHARVRPTGALWPRRTPDGQPVFLSLFGWWPSGHSCIALHLKGTERVS